MITARYQYNVYELSENRALIKSTMIVSRMIF